MIPDASDDLSKRLALLRLLQLASPALPIGAFAYSQGLEPAVAAAIVHDEATASAWLTGLLEGPLARQDRARFPSTLAGEFARATAHFGIDVRTAAETFAFTWAEAQTSAAVRLIPLGQSAGVRILARAGRSIPAAVDGALALDDDDLGGAAPGLALLSAAHETQYSRLFRS